MVHGCPASVSKCLSFHQASSGFNDRILLSARLLGGPWAARAPDDKFGSRKENAVSPISRTFFKRPKKFPDTRHSGKTQTRGLQKGQGFKNVTRSDVSQSAGCLAAQQTFVGQIVPRKTDSNRCKSSFPAQQTDHSRRKRVFSNSIIAARKPPLKRSCG